MKPEAKEDAQSGGTKANFSGSHLESAVLTALTKSFRLEVITNNHFQKNKKALAKDKKTYLIAHASFINFYGKNSSVDLLLWRKGKGVSIECKNQSVSGSVIEKHALMLLNAGYVPKPNIGYITDASIFLFNGGAVTAKNFGKFWNDISAEMSQRGKDLSVFFSLSDFETAFKEFKKRYSFLKLKRVKPTLL